MVEKHSELSGNTYASSIPTLNPEEPGMLSECVMTLYHISQKLSN